MPENTFFAHYSSWFITKPYMFNTATVFVFIFVMISIYMNEPILTLSVSPVALATAMSVGGNIVTSFYYHF